VILGQYDMAVLLFEKQTQNMRIGTYNLRRVKLDRNSPDNKWEKRKSRLIQSLLDIDTDICAVQEVDEQEQKSIPAELKKRGLEYDYHFNNPYDQEGVGSRAHGLLWRKGRFSLVGSPHHFWISNPPEKMQPNDSMPSLKKNFIRGGFCLTLQDKSGQRIFIIVTHAPLNKVQHAENASVFVNMEKQFNPQGYPSFLLGDMNANEDDACSAIYREYWTDSYHAFDDKVTARKGPEGSFNAWRMPVPPKDRRIDFIYYRGKEVLPQSYVCDNTLYEGGYPSDHFPVYVDFLIDQR